MGRDLTNSEVSFRLSLHSGSLNEAKPNRSCLVSSVEFCFSGDG
jgi:hypothetical protein